MQITHLGHAAVLLEAAGLPGIVQVGPQVWHLVAGFDSDIFATAMSRAMVPVPV